EKILRKFFESKGYKATLTNTGADGGVDVALEKNGRKEMVQAKHWKVNRVGVSVVREIYGVVQAERMHRGFIVTS
ncbi:restriction endonuclease, partial [Klebsiella pneumoniae]|nr:restriction endonuclease [Klebsiella pneumoniae]